jgi:hypothetical protein
MHLNASVYRATKGRREGFLVRILNRASDAGRLSHAGVEKSIIREMDGSHSDVGVCYRDCQLLFSAARGFSLGCQLLRVHQPISDCICENQRISVSSLPEKQIKLTPPQKQYSKEPTTRMSRYAPKCPISALMHLGHLSESGDGKSSGSRTVSNQAREKASPSIYMSKR